ncbi:signal peptidase I [Streptomyces laurentii]|uniref:Signal peptidase I n=1 Tax=Streptomyces laurentii TaxID=39478 RepID=A0A169P3N1_STRLU|nr:signal peptidase I [Streptomyces laurentii]
MGDHRGDSADSRYHLDEPEHGTVSEEQVVGRAVVIAWPIGHWRRLEQPPTFASVPRPATDEAKAAAAVSPQVSHSVSPRHTNGIPRLPTPAELLLVMGVVGLSLSRAGRAHGLRSGMWGMWPSAHDPETASPRTGQDGPIRRWRP